MINYWSLSSWEASKTGFRDKKKKKKEQRTNIQHMSLNILYIVYLDRKWNCGPMKKEQRAVRAKKHIKIA